MAGSNLLLSSRRELNSEWGKQGSLVNICGLRFFPVGVLTAQVSDALIHSWECKAFVPANHQRPNLGITDSVLPHFY